MILTYKYRIKDRNTRKLLRRHASAVNQVWNYCVALHRQRASRYVAGGQQKPWPSDFDLNKLTAGTSSELGIHAQTINEVCRQYVSSRNVHRRPPKFRASLGSRRSLGWVPFRKTSRRISGNSIVYRGKRFRFWLGGRSVPSDAKGGTFVEDARGRWYVCLYCDVDDNLQGGEGQIGIDLGLSKLATCSNGAVVRSIRPYRKHQAALGVAQRARNLKRTRAIHAKIANVRRDHLHKASKKIAAANSFIAVGNLSSSENIVRPNLGKSVSDAGWFMFKRQLDYKARRHRAVFLLVDEHLTSQVCSACGALPSSRPKGTAGLRIRRWECSSCGAHHDRDVNAAKNILRVGLSAQPLGEGSRTCRRVRDDLDRYEGIRLGQTPEDESDTELDEFSDSPSCGLNHKDGTCRKAHTDWCLRWCRQGGSRL